VDVANDILNLFAEGFQVGENVGATLRHFLMAFSRYREWPAFLEARGSPLDVE